MYYDEAVERQALDVLIEGRDRIIDINHWCQGSSVITTHSGEKRYCALGALHYQKCMVASADRAAEILGHASKRLYDIDIINLNDDWNREKYETHSRVLHVYDEAIETIKKGLGKW